MAQYQLPASAAETFVNDTPLAVYFEKAATGAKNPKMLANWVINNLRAKMAESQSILGELKFAPPAILELIELVDSGKISGKIAQEVFADMFASGEAPEQIVSRKGLLQVSDTGAIEKFCDEAIAANPRSVADYMAGKGAALNFLKGQVMKLSKGKANPNLAGQVLEAKLAKIG
jgi:aspartyl-tRNA(Asn)/glutamyl-tRNA(Gln) amidotransferase subunit B